MINEIVIKIGIPRRSVFTYRDVKADDSNRMKNVTIAIRLIYMVTMYIRSLA